MGKENDNIYGLFGDSSNMPFKENSYSGGAGGGEGVTPTEYHNDLKGRDALHSHPADAIDWNEYNLTASSIASFVNAGSSDGDFDGGYIVDDDIESIFDGGTL